jgi:hypothetical protein
MSLCLPDDVLSLVVSRLPHKAIVCISATSKHMHELMENAYSESVNSIHRAICSKWKGTREILADERNVLQYELAWNTIRKDLPTAGASASRRELAGIISSYANTPQSLRLTVTDDVLFRLRIEDGFYFHGKVVDLEAFNVLMGVLCSVHSLWPFANVCWREDDLYMSGNYEKEVKFPMTVSFELVPRVDNPPFDSIWLTLTLTDATHGSWEFVSDCLHVSPFGGTFDNLGKFFSFLRYFRSLDWDFVDRFERIMRKLFGQLPSRIDHRQMMLILNRQRRAGPVGWCIHRPFH